MRKMCKRMGCMTDAEEMQEEEYNIGSYMRNIMCM